MRPECAFSGSRPLPSGWGRRCAPGAARMPELVDIALSINRKAFRRKVRTDQRLLDVLRDDLRLTGAKEGCGKGECGACTVLVDGQAVDACLMMAYQADGARLETIEGLVQGDQLHPLPEAFVEPGRVQCGICIPGMVMAAKAFLDRSPAPPGPEDIRHALAGNLCRCTGYTKIFAAVARSAGAPRPAPPPVPIQPLAPASYRPPSPGAAPHILPHPPPKRPPGRRATDLLPPPHVALV